MSDALKRRCLHLWIDYPNEELELKILETKVPDIATALSQDVVSLMHKIRGLDLKKAPSISETLDWARALMALSADELLEDDVKATLNVILKYEGDIQKTQSELGKLLEKKTPPPPAAPAKAEAPEKAEPAKKGILH